MHCPSCNSENPDGKKFCGECGSPLLLRCANCGAENPSRFKFCGDCGAALKAKAKVKGQKSKTPNPQPPLPHTQHLAERRQLTVMFCDLVGSTALSNRLDPEELRDVVQTYQETCTEIIRRYDGHIAQHLGDGLLVYFGYPAAHEDDAARAVGTGLEIIETLQLQVPSPLVGEGQGEGAVGARHAVPLHVRIGVHTGLVVVSEIGSSKKREILALGETPNIAARLQGLAEPDTLVISAATEHLVQGLFERQDLGPRTLKGLSAPLSVYRVIRESAAQSRCETMVSKGITPLVGREEELGLLRRRWEQAKAGEGQVVLLSGEPGIGKSRLAEALKEDVRQEGATPIEFRCSPYHQNSALYPIIDHLQRLLRFGRDDTPDEKLRKLEDMRVGAHGSAPLQTIPVTLQDSLMARLDRLGPAKAIAQLGATLGREFSYELFQAVSLLKDEMLQPKLRQLVDAELIYQRGLPPQASYIFKHALVHDTAYQSLLKSTRQQYHTQIAQVLEEQFAETKETQPELLAHHYTEAGLIAQAIPYWQQAGERATQRSAYVEAIAHLTRGLDLLKTLPDAPAHAQQEISLQITLGTPLIVAKGYTAPEVETAYTRALELCRYVGEIPQLFPVLRGLVLFYQTRGDLQTARELGEQGMRLAQNVQNPIFLPEAYHTLGITLFWLGEFASARAHLEQSITFHTSQQHSSRSVSSLQEPKMHCLAYALATDLGFPSILEAGVVMRGWALAEQGQGEEGIRELRQGITAWQTMGEIQGPYFFSLLAEAHGKMGQIEESLYWLKR